jgi:phage-related tail fiber protein
MSELDKLKQQFENLEKKVAVLAKETVRIGIILPYGGATEPGDGWLFCDGRALSRAEYQKLYDVIGANFGAPDDQHFNLPDLRGRFVRGVDYSAGRDPDAKDRKADKPGGYDGDKVGSIQEDAFKKHDHQTARNQINSQYQLGTSNKRYSGGGGDKFGGGGDLVTGYKGGAETRPKNIYVNWIIKAQ